MKLIHAHIKNFRILKDLHLDFSVDNDKPLTVIRAANESGKTTSEMALIWGLFGSEALPGKGKKYPLSPSDAFEGDNRKVEVSVEIEFETEQVVPIGQGKQEIKNIRYRLLRSCTEYPSSSDDVQREEPRTAKLYEITDEGVDPVIESNVKEIIESSLPEALKDVYFTDGDSAMSFIEAAATQGAKRKRVQDAVEALLGLQVLERTVKHLESVVRKFQSKIDDTDYAKEFIEINEKLDWQENDIEEWSDELKNKESEIVEGERKLRNVKIKIEDALKLGDKEKLVKEIQKCELNIKRNKDASNRALKDLSSLMRNSDVVTSMIIEAANNGYNILKERYNDGDLPKSSIPILKELLNREDCFCGEDLSERTDEGKKRRQLIEYSIENSRNADALHGAATSLFFSVDNESFDSSARKKWLEQYSSFCENYESRIVDVEHFKNDLKEKELEKSKIDDDVLQMLRQQETSLRTKLNNARIQVGDLSGKISVAKNNVSDLKNIKEKVEGKLNKNDTSTGKLKLTHLTKRIFENIFDHLRKDEVKRVSEEMNRIFLDMIGADPEANKLATITKAELTEEFDILVYGSNGHKLNPDQDLNGASRRAITLAFILALTKVSEVKAPNVIDTPLGMMSGYVKQSVLNKTLEEGTQIILFLTHDEIQGVEGILDDKAGKVFTLTNPAHSKMLINQIQATNIGVIRCECNHRQSCDLCARKNMEKVGG